MPIEIREVVIKAQLEQPFLQTAKEEYISEEKLQQLKSEMIEAIVEKMEEKFWRMLNR